jgi:hypothetical protein
VDSAGIIQQRPTYYTDEQLEETIIIGQLVHPSRTFINLARTNPNVAYATDKQYEQFIRSFGPIKVSGHTISPNGANLKLNRTSGTAFSLGRNWINDTDNPSVVSDGAYTDCIFYRYYRGVTAGSFITVPNQTAIDPTKYDNGTGTLATVPGGKYTIQRLFYYPNTPTLLGVYYGRAEYTSLADAAANINFENFTEIENTRTNAIFAGYLLVKGGASDLTNASDALILQAGSFRSTTSGGGSVSLTLDDLTDVIITSPQNYQVLTYVDGVTGWENLSVTSLPLVSSLRGLTGAIGITNGSGIGISVSGNTLTVSNTGVLSVNGSTGTITNIARTIVDNNFIAAQTIASTSTGNATTVSPTSLTHYYDASGFSQLWQSAEANSTITFPDFTTTLAGLAGTQTFGGTKTFNALTTFNAGISSAGGTFSGDIAVNGGDITTTSTSSSLFNANATTLDILSTQSSGLTLNIANATSFGGNKIINIGRNNGGGASTILTVGSNTNDRISLLGGVTIGLVPSTITNIVGGSLNVNTQSNFNSQARFTAGISASGGITFNSNVDINSANTLTVATITNTAGGKSQLDIDNRGSARVAIGDYDGNNNSTYIFLRDNIGVLQLSSPIGAVDIGDPNAVNTGNFIYYYADEHTLYGNAGSIFNFNTIYANSAFYETANQIRVTNNARSWFL